MSSQGRNEITPKLEIELIKTIITIIPRNEMGLLGKIVVFFPPLDKRRIFFFFHSILSLNKLKKN